MPTVCCAINECANGMYRLRKWRSRVCPVHGSGCGQGLCDCPPPFRLRCFPVEPELRRMWVKAVYRVDVKTGKNWQPKKYDRICSKHFEDGVPYPTLALGHEQFTPTRPRRRLVRTPLTPMKKRPRSQSTPQCASPISPIDPVSNSGGSPHNDSLYISSCDSTDHIYSMEQKCGKCSGCAVKQKVINQLLQKINELETEIEMTAQARGTNITSLEEEEPKTFCEKLLTDKQTVKFYTGSPNIEVEGMTYRKGAKKATQVSTKVKKKCVTPKKPGPKRKMCTNLAPLHS